MEIFALAIVFCLWTDCGVVVEKYHHVEQARLRKGGTSGSILFDGVAPEEALQLPVAGELSYL